MSTHNTASSLHPPDYSSVGALVNTAANAVRDRSCLSPIATELQVSPSSADESVVLQWSPLISPGAELVSPTISQNPYSPVQDDPNLQPLDSPPAYVAASRPTQPITYTFSPLSFNSMLLIPPETAADTRPQYHISVSLNCFIPTSYVTTIRRGATEHGEYVGDFELGISDSKGTVCIRGTEHLVSQVLSKEPSYRGNGRLTAWTWKFSRRHLYWSWNGSTQDSELSATCHFAPLASHRPIVATFTPKDSLRKRDQSPPIAKLEVFPAGQGYIDHVLISALIIERMRLTPARGDAKRIFN